METVEGRYAALFFQAVRVGRQVLGPTEFGMGVALEGYGVSLVGLERYGEAESPLLEAWSILHPIVGDEHRSARVISTALAEVYAARGDEAKARQWAGRAEAASPTEAR